MAEIEVQPKKKRSFLPWLLLGLGLIALLFLLTRNRGNETADTAATNTNQETLSSTGGNAAMNNTGAAAWGDVDFNAPAVNYSEITNREINVRGNTNYGIYGVGEELLFDTDKATIRQSASQSLQQIAASITQRYNGGDIRIYGYTDAQGSAGYNKELAEQRAQAVRNWLVQNGNVPQDRISLHPVGEGNPVASNNTEQGRQQNRRVEIVARGMNNTGSNGNAAGGGSGSTDKGASVDGGTNGSSAASDPANNNTKTPRSAEGPY